MDQVLEEQLRQAFPHLYRYGAYCACHNGWFSLLWHLSARLEALIALLPEQEQEAYFADQIKEKWGQLRFYLSTSTEEMAQAIEAALQQSGQICECCGASGALLCDSGWVVTRCPLHAPETSQRLRPDE